MAYRAVKYTHVPPQWPTRTPTKIAFVAEAPSNEELDAGQPLVGPSGRIFNAIMRTAGLDRSQYLVTNVFDEKLPGNDVSAWCNNLTDARAGGYTNLPPIGAAGFLRPEHHCHLDRLQKELETCQPTVIVPLGGTALWALTGQAGITAQRGNVTSATRLVEGTKLLPTFHPAAVMHQWKLFTVVVSDLVKAEREANRGPAIFYPKRELIIEPSLQDIRDYLPRLFASDLLSVDIETGWGQITCIGFAPDAEHAICIPFMDRRNVTKSYWATVEEEVEAWKLVREVLDSNVPKLGQNFAGYDLYWLLEKYRMRVRNLQQDTRLLHHALYPELPKSLAFMGSSYSEQGSWKHWGKKQEKRDD